MPNHLELGRYPADAGVPMLRRVVALASTSECGVCNNEVKNHVGFNPPAASPPQTCSCHPTARPPWRVARVHPSPPPPATWSRHVPVSASGTRTPCATHAANIIALQSSVPWLNALSSEGIPRTKFVTRASYIWKECFGYFARLSRLGKPTYLYTNAHMSHEGSVYRRPRHVC